MIVLQFLLSASCPHVYGVILLELALFLFIV
jgi:hypothetical protein